MSAISTPLCYICFCWYVSVAEVIVLVIFIVVAAVVVVAVIVFGAVFVIVVCIVVVVIVIVDFVIVVVFLFDFMMQEGFIGLKNLHTSLLAVEPHLGLSRSPALSCPPNNVRPHSRENTWFGAASADVRGDTTTTTATG